MAGAAVLRLGPLDFSKQTLAAAMRAPMPQQAAFRGSAIACTSFALLLYVLDCY